GKPTHHPKRGGSLEHLLHPVLVRAPDRRPRIEGAGFRRHREPDHDQINVAAEKSNADLPHSGPPNPGLYRCDAAQYVSFMDCLSTLAAPNSESGSRVEP